MEKSTSVEAPIRRSLNKRCLNLSDYNSAEDDSALAMGRAASTTTARQNHEIAYAGG